MKTPSELAAGPPMQTLVRLAAPSSIAFLVQALVSMAEVFFVGQLGTTSLAAMAIVFPLFMLMMMMSAGSLGGAAGSSIARALGRRSIADAESLIWHTGALAIAGALIFSALYFLAGRELMILLGARGEILDHAATYATIAFAGAPLLWLNNVASAVYRGMGNTAFPARIMLISAVVQIPLSGALILGWGPIPQLGIAGAAIGTLIVASVSLLVLLTGLATGREVLRLRLAHCRLKASYFRDILQVALLAGLSPIFNVLTIISVTGLVARFGDTALAGYGIGSRLEFLLIPMVFGIGSAMTTLVGLHMGAGAIERAEQIGRAGAILAGTLTGVIGVLLALFPALWVAPFTSDPQTAASAVSYLRIVGPAYAFQGIGLSLYFASQGAARVGWPIVAVVARFVIAIGGAATAVLVLNGELHHIYIAASVGMVAFGVITAASIYLGAWRR